MFIEIPGSVDLPLWTYYLGGSFSGLLAFLMAGHFTCYANQKLSKVESLKGIIGMLIDLIARIRERYFSLAEKVEKQQQLSMKDDTDKLDEEVFTTLNKVADEI